MTGPQLAMEAPLMEASSRVDGFRHGAANTEGVGQGVVSYDLYKVDDPSRTGLEQVYVVSDSVGDRAGIVVGLRDVESGEPIVEIVEPDDRLEEEPRMLPKILEATIRAAGARRLRIGNSMTNVSDEVLAPNVGPDLSNKASNVFVFPPNEISPAEAADIEARISLARAEANVVKLRSPEEIHAEVVARQEEAKRAEKEQARARAEVEAALEQADVVEAIAA